MKMDARGNGQYLAEVTVQRYGEKVEAIMLSESWYREEMPRFKSFFEDGTMEIPADADHMDDYRAVKMNKGIAKIPDVGGRTKGKDGNMRHGDAAIALALVVSATRMVIADYAYEAVGKGQSKDRPELDLDRPVRCTMGVKRIQGAF